MKSIFLPVLDETTVDGVEITKEWIQKYAPTMEGKPVNIDHNYYSQIPIVVGTVDKVFFDTEGRLYAKITIGDNLAYKISDAIEGWEDNPEAVFKGVSFEWGTNENGEYEFKGLALCFKSIPKVDFAKLNHQVMVDTILASVKKIEEDIMDTEKIAGIIKDVLNQELPELVKSQVNEIFASQQEDSKNTEGNNEDSMELLASKIDENTAIMKTAIKEIAELRKEQKIIKASGGAPPNGGGQEEDYSNGVVLDL